MSKRQMFTFDPANPPTSRVLLIWPKGKGPVSVYCPPIGGKLPWVEEVGEFKEAERLAGAALRKAGGRYILLTHDTDEWWLSGLTPAS